MVENWSEAPRDVSYDYAQLFFHLRLKMWHQASFYDQRSMWLKRADPSSLYETLQDVQHGGTLTHVSASQRAARAFNLFALQFLCRVFSVAVVSPSDFMNVKFLKADSSSGTFGPDLLKTKYWCRCVHIHRCLRTQWPRSH